jgi:hypothetical protein
MCENNNVFDDDVSGTGKPRAACRYVILQSTGLSLH